MKKRFPKVKYIHEVPEIFNNTLIKHNLNAEQTRHDITLKIKQNIYKT